MADESVESRKKYITAWNKTMIDIWHERIQKLKVMNTGALWRSPIELPVRADGRFYDITLSQNFLEYGLWQDLGVGRELRHGDHDHNQAHIEKHGRVRERRKWFSLKYYSSVMALRDFMADSLGNEFVSMFCAALDSDKAESSTSYYRQKGWS
ncbi:hypothetical protein [uncultured Duncaniella sp.]|uniref:hypothetical protein n=1 Tax=uncultured Duncaniella sp. TaxID=2768039 RepID=UPI0025B70C95|nr:hypothetical protein [uncultured Duncaniella sp.]